MSLTFRKADLEDLADIVRMLADDFLGQTRERFENPLPDSYVAAFREIEADKNNELIVAEIDGRVSVRSRSHSLRRSVFRVRGGRRSNRFALMTRAAAKALAAK